MVAERALGVDASKEICAEFEIFTAVIASKIETLRGLAIDRSITSPSTALCEPNEAEDHDGVKDLLQLIGDDASATFVGEFFGL